MPHWVTAVEVSLPKAVDSIGLTFSFSYDPVRQEGLLDVGRFKADGTCGISPISMRDGETIQDVVARCSKSLLENVGKTTSAQHTKVLIDKLSAEVMVAMYLCSSRPDVVERDPRMVGLHRDSGVPQPYIIPKKAKVYEVGKKTGIALQQFYKGAIKAGSKKAHIRKAHWHGYWTGKRDGTQQRVYKHRWLGPSFINFNKEAKL